MMACKAFNEQVIIFRDSRVSYKGNHDMMMPRSYGKLRHAGRTYNKSFNLKALFRNMIIGDTFLNCNARKKK